MRAIDSVEHWCQISKLHLRDNLERKLWADVFGAFTPSHRRYVLDTAEQMADEAVVRMRIRQGTVERVGLGKGGPVGYRVCAVCEGRHSHGEYCPNGEMALPFKLADLPAVE